MWIWFDVGHSKPNDGRGSLYQRPSRHGAGRFSAPDQAAKSRAVLEYASSLYHHRSWQWPSAWLDQLCGQDIERDPKLFYGVGGWCVSCRDYLSWECCPRSSYPCSTRSYIKMASGLSGGFSLHQSICWAVDRGYSVLHSDATYTGTFPGDGISQARCHMRIVYMMWDFSDKVWKLDDLKHCKCKGT